MRHKLRYTHAFRVLQYKWSNFVLPLNRSKVHFIMIADVKGIATGRKIDMKSMTNESSHT